VEAKIGYFLTSSTVIVVFRPQTVTTIEVENILTYIAGYNSRKIIKTVCSRFAACLVVVLNTANYSHMFIASTQYQDIATGGHVVQI